MPNNCFVIRLVIRYNDLSCARSRSDVWSSAYKSNSHDALFIINVNSCLGLSAKGRAYMCIINTVYWEVRCSWYKTCRGQSLVTVAEPHVKEIIMPSTHIPAF